MRSVLTLAALAAPLSAAAADTGSLLRFITCPVYRDADSGKKSGCWLAEDPATGIRYDVSLSPHKPDWNYAVLVEGRTTAQPETPCGAPVLDAVRTSRLYDIPCTRHILPAEGYPGRRFVLPRRNPQPTSVPAPSFAGPFVDRSFTVYFEFGNDFLVYQYSDWLIQQAYYWMLSAKPKKLIITGFAASAPETVSGRVMAEPADLALQRAQTVATTMARLLPGIAIETRADPSTTGTSDAEADGIPGQAQRRVEIRAVL
ncbi:hypothetical protein GTZ99_05680 [Novosphingobium sp. FSY-8]|uniref:OmpA family protein n=1 Tax=Novosphingobium ovatum TaxID=1908523 RepID=A0ABW9XC24_9SPHN|nr:hypothetical protein [Novosphingobium ovatum]